MGHVLPNREAESSSNNLPERNAAHLTPVDEVSKSSRYKFGHVSIVVEAQNRVIVLEKRPLLKLCSNTRVPVCVSVCSDIGWS